jgi:hypothetical protein
MSKHRIDTSCTYCGARTNFARGDPSDRSAIGPVPGDVGICAGCGMVNVFDEYLQFRQPTAEEAVAHKADAKVLAARKHIHKGKH